MAVARLLLDAHAEPTFRPQRYGKSPLDSARKHGLVGLKHLFEGRKHVAVKVAEEIILEECKAQTIVALREACRLLSEVNFAPYSTESEFPLPPLPDDQPYNDSSDEECADTGVPVGLTAKAPNTPAHTFAGEAMREPDADVTQETSEDRARRSTGGDFGAVVCGAPSDGGGLALGMNDVTQETSEERARRSTAGDFGAVVCGAPPHGGSLALGMKNVRVPSYCEAHHFVALTTMREQPYYCQARKQAMLKKVWKYDVLGKPEESKLFKELNAL